MISVRSVLVEYEDTVEGNIYANSGCIIADKYVLITSNALIKPLLKLNDFENRLKFLPPGFSPSQTFLPSVPEVNIVLRRDNPYLSKRAKVSALYVSDRIRKQTPKYFSDWTIDEDDKGKQIKDIVSLFFVVAINEESYSESIDGFARCLREFCAKYGENPIGIGDKITIEGVPFGNRNFFKSRSRGIVSNTFGTGNCFILTDTPSAPGCEGGPMYLRSKNYPSGKEHLPIGMVLASLCWWNGEWIGLTLGATFSGIFPDLTPKCEITRTLRANPNPILEQSNTKKSNKSITDVVRLSIVRVICGASWGSGVLIDEKNGIFITNSHVAETTTPILLWQNIEIKSTVIYQVGENETYDLALVAADLEDLRKTNMRAPKLSRDEVFAGETVFAVGFPLFPRQTKLEPTVTKGQISQVTAAMIKTTCSILPGASGGALLRKDGDLIGIITGNTKLHGNKTPFPRVNMAIPVRNVIDVISTYIATREVGVLQKLSVDDPSLRGEWNICGSKL